MNVDPDLPEATSDPTGPTEQGRTVTSDDSTMLEPTLDAADRQLLAEEIARLSGTEVKPVAVAGYALGTRLGEDEIGAVFEVEGDAAKAIEIVRKAPWRDPPRLESTLDGIRPVVGRVHRYLLTTHDLGIEDDTAWVVTDRTSGRTLRSWQQDESRTWPEIILVYLKVAHGLVALHEHGVLHGNVTPDQVLIDEDGTPRLVGYGLAMVDDRHGVPGGAPEYLAPEVLHDVERSEHADQYGLCVSLFEALMGSHPYSTWSFVMVESMLSPHDSGVSAQALRRSLLHDLFTHIDDGVIRWPPAAAGLPDEIRAALHRGLRPDPHERYPSVGEFIEQIGQIGQSEQAIPPGAVGTLEDLDLDLEPAVSDEALYAAYSGNAEPGIDEQRMLATVLQRTLDVERQPVSLGRFDLQDKLGQGGMGIVYRAFDPQLDREIALKVLHGQDGRAEAQAMARVSSEYVVKVWEIGEEGDDVWISMELIEGSTLRAWQSQGRQSWTTILEVYRAAGRGLAAAHEQDLVHGDFKPDNVLIGDDLVPKITDFGLARRGSEPGLRGGTPEYMAPEQFLGQCDQLSDQFSFSLCIFEVLFRMHPYADSSYDEFASTLRSDAPELTDAAIRQRYRRSLVENMERGEIHFPRLPGRIPRHIRRALTRGLSVDAKARFGSMDELIKALDLRRAQRQRAIRIAAPMVTLALGAGVTNFIVTQRRVEACQQLEARFDDSWSEADRQRVVRAHPGAAREISLQLDRYRATWSEAHQTVCRNTVVEGNREGWEQVSSCFDQHLADARAIVTALPSSETPLNLVHGLESRSPVRCRLDGVGGPIPEPGADQELARIQRGLADALVDEISGRYEQGIERMDELIGAAETLGYDPLLADAYYRRGRLRIQEAIYANRDTDEPASTPGMRDLQQAQNLAAGSFARSVFFDARIFQIKAMAVLGAIDDTWDQELSEGNPAFSELLDDQRAELMEARGIAAKKRADSAGPESVEGNKHIKAAVRYYEAALALRTALGDDVGRAKVLENIGQAQLAAGEYEAAEASLGEAIEFWVAQRDSDGYLPHLYTAQISAIAKIDQARARARTKQVVQELADDPEGMVVVLNSAILSNWGRPEGARLAHLAMQLLDAGTQVTVEHELQLRLFSLGAVLRSPNAATSLDLDEAKRWSASLRRLLDQYGERLTPDLRGMAWSYLGGVSLVDGDFEAAVEAFERASRAAQAMDALEGAYLHLDLIDALLGVGDMERARQVDARTKEFLDAVIADYGDAPDSPITELRQRSAGQRSALAGQPGE